MQWLAIAMVLILSLSAAPARAQETGQTATWTGTYQGRQLTVAVMARGHTISPETQANEPWWRWGNTTTDAYFFYWTPDGSVDLILDFITTDGLPTATLYAPWLAPQRSGIQINSATYSVPANLPPSAVVYPRKGGWWVGDQPNWDVEGTEVDNSTGELTWRFSVGGRTRSGLPQWITRTRIYDPRPGDGYTRFEAATLKDETVPYSLVEPLMPTWPYLSIGSPDDFAHYDGLIRPLLYDPFSRVITHKWLGFHTGGMYQVNSLAYPPATNFESPFVFYRFDPQAERYPNLVVRSDIWPSGSMMGPPPAYAQRTAMRMTWTGKDPGQWRYSLSVAGNHAPTETVIIGGTPITATSYEQLPAWIADRPWKAVTFVEDVDGETGSEGIYDYSMEDNWQVHLWINGRSLNAPADYRSPMVDFPRIDPRRLNPGLRGEYSLVYDRTPQLYFSPIDNRSHLAYATEGIWNLDTRRVLRTLNVDGDATIDAWVRERLTGNTTAEDRRAVAGEVEEALYSLDDLLIYSGPDGAVIRRPETLPLNQDLPTPVDAASWMTFTTGVAASMAQPRNPLDLAGWLTAFPGPSLHLRGATISDVRFTSDGLRFALTLREGFEATEESLIPLGTLSPGAYVVVYTGEFDIQPLVVTPPTMNLSPTMFVRLQPGALQYQVGNPGGRDIVNALLEVRAMPRGIDVPFVLSQTVSVPAGGAITAALPWSPPRSGEWNLETRLHFSDGAVVEHDPEFIYVQPEPTSTAATVIEVTGGIPGLALIAFMMAIALGIGIGWHALTPARREESDDWV